MNADQLLDMAMHFRGLACAVRDMQSAIELTQIAGEYESLAATLKESGESILATPVSLPGRREFA